MGHEKAREAGVSANQVVGELGQVISEIEANIRQRAMEFRFDGKKTDELIGYMNERVMLLVGGLLPAEDYNILSGQIDKWVGNAREVTRNASELETCERAVKLSLDAIQGNMITNGQLNDLARSEIARRWPSERPEAD